MASVGNEELSTFRGRHFGNWAEERKRMRQGLTFRQWGGVASGVSSGSGGGQWEPVRQTTILPRDRCLDKVSRCKTRKWDKGPVTGSDPGKDDLSKLIALG